MHNPRLQWMNYLTNRWTSRSREKKFAREPKNKFSKNKLSTDDNWWINRRNIWYIAFVRTRGIYESWILLNHHVLFFYMSTCNSRLSDLIVPIAGLSIVWFITATKLHSNGNTMGWQQHGRKRILLELNLSKLSKIFFFFFRLFDTTLEWIYKWTVSKFINWTKKSLTNLKIFF